MQKTKNKKKQQLKLKIRKTKHLYALATKLVCKEAITNIEKLLLFMKGGVVLHLLLSPYVLKTKYALCTQA